MGSLTIVAHAATRGRLGHAVSPGPERPDGGTATACVGHPTVTKPIDLADSPRARRAPPGPSQDADEHLDDGWIPDTAEQSNFLEGVHIQAYYFEARWFPRLRWFTLRPPEGQYFVIGDRPVGWGVPECLDAPPCCLRDEGAFLVAPLSRSLALVGRNDSTPWAVTPSQVNALLAAWSLDWIAGPTADVVADALRGRRALNGRCVSH